MDDAGVGEGVCGDIADGHAQVVRWSVESVHSVMAMDPLSGYLFVFFNQPRNRVKILWWHQGGFNLFCQRVERGCFGSARMSSMESTHQAITGMELAMILEGIDWKSVKKRPRWALKNRI